jgi:hypothetical protein
MAVSGVSSGPAAYHYPQNNVLSQFAQLAKSVTSGNLTGAQQAYGQLTQTLGNTHAGNSKGAFAQALNAIGQALQSGNIIGAQQALTSLQQAQGGRGETAAAGASAGSSSPTSNTSGGPSGNRVDLTV